MTSRNRLTTINSDDHDPNHHSHHEHTNDEIEEVPEIFPVRTFDATYCGEVVPAGFDAVKVAFDGTIKADLSWKKEREAALAYTAQGLRILWEIDLGLQGALQHALGNKTQFLGLTLSLEHFCETLWKEFRKETVGLCLYRGPVDFSTNYVWDEEQVLNLQDWTKDLYASVELFDAETGIKISDFSSLDIGKMQTSKVGSDLLKCFCRDAVGEYLSLLSARVPDTLPLFLLFDTCGIEDPMLAARLLTKERYPRFHLGVKGFEVLGGGIVWGSQAGIIATQGEKAKLGFCVPRMSLSRPSSTQKLGEALEKLIEAGEEFRVIPEVNLAAEWDGLDYLVFDTQHVDVQFKRKLQGFCAAGGAVMFIGEPLGLAHEIAFSGCT